MSSTRDADSELVATAGTTSWAELGTPMRGIGIATSLLAFATVSVLLGLWAGRGHSDDPDILKVFLTMRGYRVGVAFFAGGSIAVAGAVVQGLVRNPLASPTILGANAGALLGGKLALFTTFVVFGGLAPTYISPEMLVPLGCLAGALASLMLVLSIQSLRGSTVSLILTGFVMNGLLLSLGTFLSNLSQDFYELNRAMATLSAGSISGVGPLQLMLAVGLAGFGILPVLFWSSSLDVLLSGEEEAATLGVEVPRVRFWCVLWASVLSAGACSVGANVGFIDLITPHVVRRFTGPSHRYVLPGSFLLGGSFLVLCDAACRAVPLAQEVPLQVLVELIGAPTFLWMLKRFGSEQRHG